MAGGRIFLFSDLGDPIFESKGPIFERRTPRGPYKGPYFCPEEGAEIRSLVKRLRPFECVDSSYKRRTGQSRGQCVVANGLLIFGRRGPYFQA